MLDAARNIVRASQAPAPELFFTDRRVLDPAEVHELHYAPWAGFVVIRWQDVRLGVHRKFVRQVYNALEGRRQMVTTSPGQLVIQFAALDESAETMQFGLALGEEVAAGLAGQQAHVDRVEVVPVDTSWMTRRPEATVHQLPTPLVGKDAVLA